MEIIKFPTQAVPAKEKLVTAVAIATATSTVLLSMTLNVWAFSDHLPGLFAWTVGALLPLWVLALTLAGKVMNDKGKRTVGIGAYVLAGFLLIVSLPHLATGFDKITGGVWWESWSLALVTDLTQVVMKLVVIGLLQQTEATTVKQATKRKTTVRKAA
jgi:hypothetical protein